VLNFFKNLKSKAYYFLNSLLIQNNSQIKFMLGTIFLNEAKKKYDLVDNLHDVEYKVFSQTGGDGIIDFLLSRINISTGKFVEIGVGDYSEANTRYIY